MRLTSIVLLWIVVLVSIQNINALPSSEEKRVASENSKEELQEQIEQSKGEAGELQASGDSSIAGEKVLELAKVYLQRNRPDSVKKILESALQSNSESDFAAQYMSLLGNAYNRTGQFARALSHQQEALLKTDTTKQRNLYGDILQRMGAAESNMGNFGSAFNNYLKAIRIAEEVQDSSLLAAGLNKLGVAYNDYGNYEKGEQTLRRANRIFSELDDRTGQMEATVNLANSYYQMEEFDQAIKSYEQALQIHEEIRSTPPYLIYYNFGQTYKDMGELGRAEEYYRQSLAYCEEHDIRQGLAYNYGGLGHIAELRGNAKQAVYYYDQALVVARQIGAKTLISEALKALYEISKEQNNIRTALQYHEEYTQIKDSLEEETYEQQLAETESRLSLINEQEVNRLLREKQEAQQERIKSQNIGLIVGGIFIIVILISLYMLYRGRQERDQVNAVLQEERKNLEELNDVKDKLLAIASHDLRSPLSSLKGMIELFKNEKLTKEERRQMVTELEIRLDQNINLLDNLLVWARNQMSGLTINRKILSARDITEKVIGKHRPAAEHKGVRLINNVREDLKVKADENILQLILRNLISNAVKFTEEGDQIEVEAERTGSKILFMIMDTGIGIPRDKQHEIFSINSDSREGTHNEQGSGLGLGLCKEFITKMGGSISVESEVGEGTTFVFSLPRAHPESMELEQPKQVR